MKAKLKKKFLIIIAVTAFSISLVSILFYIFRPTPPIIDTFKIHPIRFSSQDKEISNMSEKIRQCNEVSTRVKIFLGPEIVIDEKNLGRSFTVLTYYDWRNIIKSKVKFDDFSGHRIFIMPAQIFLQDEDFVDLIRVSWQDESLISTGALNRTDFYKKVSYADYTLIAIQSIITSVFHAAHNPSTNRCLNDYAMLKRNLIIAFQNGPLCPKCRNIIYDKEPEILRDIYHMYNIVECQDKRHIHIGAKGSSEEIEGLLFPKEKNTFDWKSWFEKLTLTIISAFIGIISTYIIKKIKGKDKEEEN